ncbi:MAG: hypothetical protein E2O84_01655 [Bacteroidetes bacterium]|nr:MAG: hypothetical protein E2O84_01655 [Bacteroidota bacterium]
MRTVPGGAIAWRRSIFEECRKWDTTELIDKAVDIAWETLYSDAESSIRRENKRTRFAKTDLVIRRSGSFIVFSLRSDVVPQFLNQAA